MKRFLALVLVMAYALVTWASVSVTVNGTSYTIPQTNERGWGTSVTSWIQAMSQYSLQPTGGTFALTNDVNFGANYGLKSKYFSTRDANPAGSGLLRLTKSDTIGWRNNANDGNLLLAIDSSDRLTFGGVILPSATSGSFQDSTFNLYDNSDATKKIAFEASGITTGTTRTVTMPDANVNLGALTNSNIDASAAIAYSKLNLAGSIVNADIGVGAAIGLSKLAALSTDIVPVTDGSGTLTSSAVTATELGYIDGVTSSVQTQLDAKTEKSTLTTKGDIYVATGSAAVSRLGVGTNGQILTADSSETPGVKWADPPSNPATTKGDLSGYDTAPARVPVGSDGDLLVADSGEALGLRWSSWLTDMAFFVDANIAGGNPDLGTSAVTSYTEVTNGSLTLTPASGSAPVGIMCSSTNAAATPSTSPTTCSAGSESVGFNVNVPRAGVYEACVAFSHYAAIDPNEELITAFQLVETATNAQTILQEGGDKTYSGLGGGAGTYASVNSVSPYRKCGIFNFASSGTKAIRLMYEQYVTGTPLNSLVVADGNTALGQRDIHITMRPWVLTP